MENSKGVLVRRGKEGGTGSATTMDMVQERLNKETRGTEVVVFIRDEINRKVGKPVVFSPNLGSRRV